jgi:ABC-type iron transport system FetAB permease component
MFPCSGVIIVNEARKHARRQTPVIVAWLISSAIAISFALSYIYQHRADGVTIVCLAVMASFAPVFLYHREVMKKYVTKKRKVHESEVRNGG